MRVKRAKKAEHTENYEKNSREPIIALMPVMGTGFNKYQVGQTDRKPLKRRQQVEHVRPRKSNKPEMREMAVGTCFEEETCEKSIQDCHFIS